MNGAVIPNTPIAVDFWRLRQCPHSRIFFLSHMHADHTAGLTSSWNTYTIYCSELTKKLATAKLGVNSDLVVGLPLDEPVIIKLDEQGQQTMSVTLVDANHCPGSVMFIFEGYFGKILYTGDFRYCERLTTHSAILEKRFDVLYLDNTYCDPKCDFPSRTQATMKILEIIRRYPDCKVVIGLHNLGKELLLHSIATVFKTWIGVDPLRKETLELLEMPNVFTCDVDKVRIRVVKNREITKNNMQVWNSEEPTIAILPTCLYVGATNPFANVENVFVVPYSDHSSFEELRKFVQIVKPRRIIPIVHKHRQSPGETINNRVNMNVFQSLMDSSPLRNYTVPHSVVCFMSSEARQHTNKKLKATGQICMRKAAKIKKPQGVVFPPSPETTAMEEDKRESEALDVKSTTFGNTGNKEHSLAQEITENKRSAVTSAIKCCLADSKTGRRPADGGHVIAEEITGDENKVALSQYSKWSMSESDEIGRSNKGHSGFCEEDNDMAQMITEDEVNAIVSPTIECGKIGSESEGMSDMDINSNEKDGDVIGNKVNAAASSAVESHLADSKSEGKLNMDNFSVDKGFQGDSMVQETTGNEISSVPLSSVRQGLTGNESGKEAEVLNSVGDKEVKEAAVASAIKTKNLCNENSNSPKRNYSINKIKPRDLIKKNVTASPENISLKNHSLKRKYKEIDDNSCEHDVHEVDEHSSSRKKFNIYTGYTCEFARKVLEDLMTNGAFRDK